MKAARKACWLGVVVSLFLNTPSWAFPGPLYSLIDNWSAASLVVCVEVESVKFEQRQEVVLIVSDVLKEQSEATPNTLRIFTHNGIGCGAPYRFQLGKQMIVFLTLDSESRRYTPTSYTGCIEVDEQGMQDYTTALKQLPEILSLSHPKLKDEKLLDWYVDCAVLLGTRSVGTAGIAKYQRRSVLRKLITREYQQRLLKVLLAERPPGKDASELASVLTPYPSRELGAYLLECLRRSHEPGWEDVTETAVKSLPGRLGIELDALIQKRLAQWEELALEVYNDLDPEVNVDNGPESLLRYRQQKQRLDILWGQLTAEIHAICKREMESRE